MLRNLITEIAGVRVGHANARELCSGVTAILFDEPVVASIDVRGGGPGSHETELLDPAMTVEHIDAICLSGGSAFGLEAAAGIQAYLREQGRGFAVGSARVPIVPGATLFDLLYGGSKDWGRFSPYRDLGYAAGAAAAQAFGLGSVGAGLGATTVNLKAGIGSASASSRGGHLVAALVAVNAAGSAIIGRGPWFWAAPYEQGKEFGGIGWPSRMPDDALDLRTKGTVGQNTTIALVATDATLTKAQVKRLAMMAQDGLSRALYPVHTLLDGDVVFAVSTGRTPVADPLFTLSEVGALAANVLARAIARGVFEATALPSTALPSWRDVFGR
jgi:L-aminopeptidase/D-esterase-like protein